LNRTGAERRHHAASVLFVLAWLCWFHRWAPAAAVVILVLWVVLHHRLEAGLADVLRARWRRAWRSRLLAITLLAASALVFALADAALETRILPIALDAAAISILVLGQWWRHITVPRWLGGERTVRAVAARSVVNAR
jgi:hypothetical protein